MEFLDWITLMLTLIVAIFALLRPLVPYGKPETGENPQKNAK